ncbi:MAG: N-succinylarginine dihydrolase [Myxococcales bacterium]
MALREYNFDGLVGPTHNYGGLSVGNVASQKNTGKVSNPREAALQGLEKMRFVASLSVGQALLPPHPRPSLATLRRLGFTGSDEEVMSRAAREDEHLVRLCSSAAAMWTANAATVAPSADTADGRFHATPANLQEMFHRSLEAPTTTAVLRAIFADRTRFEIHDPLPGGGQLADEGAANHTRLITDGHAAVHVFGWGRSAFRDLPKPTRYPARQTLESSRALARLHRLDPAQCLFPQQEPEGIDDGAFHTDVLAVGNGSFLMLHEKAFLDREGLLRTLREKLGDAFRFTLATEAELPVAKAVAAYPFNSQVVSLPDGSMAIVAPVECGEQPEAKRFLDRVLAEDNPVKAVHYLDLRQSMNNGGGPACLRLRVALTDEERAAVRANVFYGSALHDALAAWVKRHYRDRLHPSDLLDPALARETMEALDALTGILGLGSVYEFQQDPARRT